MSASTRALDGGDGDLLHRHHRLEGALCLTATSRKRIGQRTRGDLPGEAPAVLAPTACAFRSAIADDRIPVTVRLFLMVRRDLKGKSLGVPERQAAVETETGNAQDGELHSQHIALLAARIVTGSLVNSGYFTVRKGGGVEARRLMRVLFETEANRVLWLHVRVLLVLDHIGRFKTTSRQHGFVKRYGLVRDDRHEAPPVMVPFRRSPARPFAVLPHHRLGVLPLGSP